jgi:hypothetical protein
LVFAPASLILTNYFLPLSEAVGLYMLSITVNYIWSEYLNVITEFAPINSYKEKHGKLPSSKIKISLWDTIVAHLFGSLIFAIKVRKVGLCTFKFSANGFERKSNVGEKFIAWDKVLHIHQLTDAYLMELEQGFIPLPFRCFGDHKLEFENIVSNKLVS